MLVGGQRGILAFFRMREPERLLNFSRIEALFDKLDLAILQRTRRLRLFLHPHEERHRITR